LALLANGAFPRTGAWFGVGSDDTIPVSAVERLVPASRAVGIETCVDEIEGDHTFVTFRRLLARSFPWITMRLGLTTGAPSVEADCGGA
jgi:hypothetical protein